MSAENTVAPMRRDLAAPRTSTSRRLAHVLKFAAGWLAGILLLAGLAEAFLRLFPPSDLHVYLGDASPLAGPYVPDRDFAVSYRSWEAFCEDNTPRMQSLLAADESDTRPTWAFFGNSFVQAPGMLADRAREGVPQRKVFNLGRNEHLCLRMAQIKLLLENGFRPQRLFFIFMPVDVLHVGQQPLATMYPTSRGALTYRPRLPDGPGGWLVENSRLALTGWVRMGWQVGNPDFNRRTVYDGINATTLADLRVLFGNLASVANKFDTPITVVLIPAYHQVCGQADYGFQNALSEMLRAEGFDVLDPRDAFAACPDKASLFIPDKHFTARGNQILLGELLRHCDEAPQVAGRSEEATLR